MTLIRKETAWKKSRKFGDVKGGRRWPKITDNIFARFHSLQKPSAQDELPIFIKDNPSRDFYFPINEQDIRDQLKLLPKELSEGITYIWLRRADKKEYEIGEGYQAIFISGSGVNLIVLNAFAKDLRMHFGRTKPEQRHVRQYLQWQPTLQQDEKSGSWFLQWEETQIKDYYLNGLLLHELGHFNDVDRSNKNKSENHADMFAIFWCAKLKQYSSKL